VKKSVLGFTIFFLFFGISATGANGTAPKSGVTCKNLGQNVITGGYSYTCLKSGKTLIWIKGAKIKTSQISKVSTPQPVVTSPSPIAQSQTSVNSTLPYDSSRPQEMQSCTSGSPWVIGYAHASTKLIYLSCGPDNFLHPETNAPDIDQITGQPEVSPASTQNTSIPSNLLADDGTGNMNILISAITQVSNHTSVSTAPKLVEYIDPAFSQDFITSSEKSAHAILSAFADQYGAGTTYYLVYATTKDFALKAYQDISNKENYPEMMDPNGNVLPGLADNLISSDSQTFNGGAITSGFSGGNFEMTTFFQGPHTPTDFIFMTPGEMKHGLFYALANGQQLSPCFMTPGNLGLFGAAFGVPDETALQKVYRFATSGGSLRQAENDTLFQTLDLSSLDGNSHAPADGTECGVPGDYVISPIGVAYLVGKYGLDKELAYVKLFGQNPANWQNDFQQIYGFSLSDFYSEAHDYLVWYKKWFYSFQLFPH
jgi:hypothetical protein